MIGLLGIPFGWLWAQIAPPQRLQVAQSGSAVPLPAETFHRFDAVVIFALIGLAAGVLTGFAVWMLRERRGPVVLVAAVLGSLLAAWLATRMGTAFAENIYTITATPRIGDLLARPPNLESGWVIIAQPLTTALTYGMLAAWNGMDDLGRRLG
ncbi:MAG: DUF2567 domain-containing protein [Pseudonocardiaceae bacterium]|nr:DUF2567 domain-containing protein [Pseudonocardiaceae bacterium]